uniref:Uncharacterized protein n=1 Tax=Romanomermis culicivorax TaxID=13658 RepID=A0A915ILN2_ROMCU
MGLDFVRHSCVGQENKVVDGKIACWALQSKYSLLTAAATSSDMLTISVATISKGCLGWICNSGRGGNMRGIIN